MKNLGIWLLPKRTLSDLAGHLTRRCCLIRRAVSCHQSRRHLESADFSWTCRGWQRYRGLISVCKANCVCWTQASVFQRWWSQFSNYCTSGSFLHSNRRAVFSFEIRAIFVCHGLSCYRVRCFVSKPFGAILVDRDFQESNWSCVNAEHECQPG